MATRAATSGETRTSGATTATMARSDGDHPGGALGQRAARDRAPALVGVAAVVLDVAQVVEQVAGTRDRAEGDEGHQDVGDGAGLVEAPREDDPGEDQDVLHPLLRAQR